MSAVGVFDAVIRLNEWIPGELITCINKFSLPRLW